MTNTNETIIKILNERQLSKCWKIKQISQKDAYADMVYFQLEYDSVYRSWTDFPILYEHGEVGYDNPYIVPESIKRLVKAFMVLHKTHKAG